MSRRLGWILAALLVFALGLAGYWFVRHGWLHFQAALAAEQTLYFEQARDKALESSRPQEIVRCIEGTLNYYPSGTKQTTGSPLDVMVERARRLAVDDMIRQLRSKTGLDLGNSPDTWIERFGESRDHVGAANRSQPVQLATNSARLPAGSGG